jgi:hypothetical protein
VPRTTSNWDTLTAANIADTERLIRVKKNKTKYKTSSTKDKKASELLRETYRLHQIMRSNNQKEISEKIESNLKEVAITELRESSTPDVVNYYFLCRNCEGYVLSSNMASMEDRKYYQSCKPCAEEGGWQECPKCGGYASSASDCSCKHKKKSSAILNEYNYKPHWKNFKADFNDNLLFGIELEIERMGTDLSKTNSLYKKDWIVYKRDGSLSGQSGTGGFELVTMPLGWRWMQENRKEISEIFELSKQGFKSRVTATCGMHIHITKTAFTTYNLYKYYQFMISNLDLLHLMSGRSWSNLQRWAAPQGKDGRTALQQCLDKTCTDRHIAINLKNPESVEIRIFRGTLSSTIFWRNIEFCKSVYDFIKEINLAECEELRKYYKYIDERKFLYPNLYEFLFSDAKEIL